MGEVNQLQPQNIEKWANELEKAHPQTVLEWGLQQFGDDMILACSFGAEDVVLLDMLVKLTPQPNVFYLDTNKHFSETYETRDRLIDKYNVSFIQVKPNLSLKQQSDKFGERLWETNPDLCCKIRKVEPLQNILAQNKAWITGIRREQAPTRAHARKVEWDQKFGIIKLNPLASWIHRDVWNYIHQHQVPYNPLHDRNYPSIGCQVCTRPVKEGEDPRAGRWSHTEKLECGLHK